VRLLPVNRESFVTADGKTLVNFLEFRKGRPGYLFAGRLARRSSPPAKRKAPSPAKRKAPSRAERKA
jgi:hypothetical protein